MANSGANIKACKLKGQARGGQGPHQEGGDIFRQEVGEEGHVQVERVVPDSKDVVKG